MKNLFFLILLTAAYLTPAQGIKDFEGHWSGSLFSCNGKTSINFTLMRLIIEPADTAGVWTYKMIYSSKDVRNYKLRTINAENNKYAIDEGNGIILNQDLFENKFFSCFETGNSLLMITLEKTENGLVFETCSMPTNNKKTSGQGTKESPFVYSYPVISHQRAFLVKD
jgi:hypothetical protein